MGTPRPVTILSAERGPGPASVIYRVDRVGSFTLAPYSRYPAPDGTTVRVTYGAAVDDPEQRWNPEVTDRPRVNGVAIDGYSAITTETALTHLAAVRDDSAMQHGAWHVARPHRHAIDGGFAGEVPTATRDRCVLIAATLIEDYIARDDYFDMLRAYSRSKAKDRLAVEQRDITRLREEIATRQAELAEHVSRAVDQSWLLPPEDVTLDVALLREEVMPVPTG